MNYRHAFHAGNHADVLKHAVLVFALARLKRKPAPFAVLDAHAGEGAFDLAAPEAARSPEWKDGVGKLWDWPDLPEPFRPYRDAVAALNPDGVLRLYPGSPWLIAAALRETDRLIACERRPDAVDALRRLFAADKRVQIHARDAFEGLRALLPFAEGRGLVLVDPPYEQPDEWESAAAAIAAALSRWPNLQILWWRPLKQASLLARADAAFAARETCRLDLAIAAPAKDGKLVASSLLAINPPFGLREAMAPALPLLARRLAIAPGAAGSVA